MSPHLLLSSSVSAPQHLVELQTASSRPILASASSGSQLGAGVAHRREEAEGRCCLAAAAEQPSLLVEAEAGWAGAPQDLEEAAEEVLQGRWS